MAVIFSASTRPVPYSLAPAALPGAPKRAIANDLSVAACVRGDRTRDLRSVRPGARGPGSAAGFDAADSYSLRLS